ncbi:MAG: FAD-dependent oxidoreductase [Gemmatimonadota bacterium]
MTVKRLLLAVLVAAAVAGFFVFDLAELFSLESLKARQAELDGFYRENPWTTIGGYFAAYVIMAGLSLPGAAIMTLAGGAILGFVTGTIVVSFASTIGATLAFLVGRFLFRDAVQNRFGSQLRAANEGVERDGAFYLFMLRLVPVFPFFAINLLMALTPMKAVTFYLVSQIGMLAGSMVYVNAGTRIAQIESLGGILSPGLLGAFALLGVFPLVARWTARGLESGRALRGWMKPKRFDRNLIVVGAGAAGLVTAYIAAAVKAKVTLIEREKMGGDCLNTGCVPSKTLIRSARFAHDVKRHRALGFADANERHDFPELMARVRRVIARIEPHDSVERYEGLGVEVIQGEARVTGPWSVEVKGETLTTRHIVIATGAGPFVPAIPGLDEVGYFTSETIWTLTEHPGRLLVLGCGPVGCELAQSFQRLGVPVTQLEVLPRILVTEDEDASALVEGRMREEGVDLHTGHRVVRFAHEGGEKVAYAEHEGGTARFAFDHLLVAVGRKARVEGFGLEEVGVTLKDGRIETDEMLRTRVPTIFACGDCVGPYQFTHAASHQAWHAAVNSLFSNPFKRFRVDYSVLPLVTFTDPEVARVGLNERQAAKRGVEVQVTRYDLAGLDRAIADEEAVGFVKILTRPGKDRILGATVVGERAGELVAELALAMKHGIGLNKILGTVHAYPTLAEANKMAAGVWKRTHAPERVLRLVERYHVWRRR